MHSVERRLVSLDHEAQGQHNALLGDVGAIQRGLVGFGARLMAPRAAKAAQTVAVFSKALTRDIARFASHCCFSLFCALHDSIIQLALAVCQWQIFCDTNHLFCDKLRVVLELKGGAGVRLLGPADPV